MPRLEKFKEEDERNASRIEAKSKVENYCYSLKNSMNDEKIKDKVSDDDRKQIMDTVETTISWLEGNQDKNKEEYEEKYKEVEAICAPIMSKMYQAPGGMPGGMSGGMPGSMSGGMPGGMPDMSQMTPEQRTMMEEMARSQQATKEDDGIKIEEVD